MSMEKHRPNKPVESVCIQAERIYDSCKCKDCVSNLRVYFSAEGQSVINSATNIRVKCSEVLCVEPVVDKAQFNRCCYNVNITFYFRVIVEVTNATGDTTCIEGLAIHNKNVVLFGSEVSSFVFSSRDPGCASGTNLTRNAILPTAIVETLDPVVLDIKLLEQCTEAHQTVINNCCACNVPGSINCYFPDGIVEEGEKRVYVTLGIFAMVRLQRNTQLLIPCYDFCIPSKDCKGAGCENDPCSFFDKLDFPFGSFYPSGNCNNTTQNVNTGCGCINDTCQTTIPYVPNIPTN